LSALATGPAKSRHRCVHPRRSRDRRARNWAAPAPQLTCAPARPYRVPAVQHRRSPHGWPRRWLASEPVHDPRQRLQVTRSPLSCSATRARASVLCSATRGCTHGPNPFATSTPPPSRSPMTARPDGAANQAAAQQRTALRRRERRETGGRCGGSWHPRAPPNTHHHPPPPPTRLRPMPTTEGSRPTPSPHLTSRTHFTHSRGGGVLLRVSGSAGVHGGAWKGEAWSAPPPVAGSVRPHFHHPPHHAGRPKPPSHHAPLPPHAPPRAQREQRLIQRAPILVGSTARQHAL
jgi:hypothetical protein